MDNNLLIYGGIALIIILIVIIAIIVFKKDKKEIIEPVTDEFLEKLYTALGKADNIETIDIEHQRIRLILKDVKNVNANILRELEIPAFLKGKELKILVKHHTKEVYRYISERRVN